MMVHHFGDLISIVRGMLLNYVLKDGRQPQAQDRRVIGKNTSDNAIIHSFIDMKSDTINQEDFYHAFLAGIFTGAGYMVEPNREHGEERSDVVVKDLRHWGGVLESLFIRGAVW